MDNTEPGATPLISRPKKATKTRRSKNKPRFEQAWNDHTSDVHGMAKPKTTEIVRFPIPASIHGTSTILVNVGIGPAMRSFSIHQGLLRKASPYFASRLSGNYEDGKHGEIDLGDDCPLAFEVLYQFLYSGKVIKAKFYTQAQIEDDVLWLRVYKLADKRMVERLQEIAYDKLKDIFTYKQREVPSSRFVDELFSTDCESCDQLQCYLIAHTAFWMKAPNSGSWQTWHEILYTKPKYGVAVALQIAKVQSEYAIEGADVHPAQDDLFDSYRATPTLTEEFPFWDPQCLSDDDETVGRIEGEGEGEGENAVAEQTAMAG